MASGYSRRHVPADYKIACICSMSVELAPIEGMLDEVHDPLPVNREHNAYSLGAIAGHNVVIAVMPEIGNNAAASTATQLMNDFPSIRFGLLVGIGGGVPGSVDVRLGDVVVSQPTDVFPGVVQYDMGKELEGGQFQRTGSLNKPPAVLSAIVRKLAGQHRRLGHNLGVYLSEMFRRYPEMQAEYSRPTGMRRDQLFLSTYKHVSGPTCDRCDGNFRALRSERGDEEPRVHYGTIGSANVVVRDAELREKIREEINALCIEMEAAGLMSDFPCLVIRGICDYADSHKNKEWQPYAAAVAAAYLKALLLTLPARVVDVVNYADQSTIFSSNFTSSPTAQDLESDETRPVKRIRIYDDENASDISHGYSNPGTRKSTSHIADADDHSQHALQVHEPQPTCLWQDNYDVLLKSLLFDRINFRVNNVKRPMLSTCEWLFRHPDFQKWDDKINADQSNGFLWIKGKPGCGKSTLMKTALERARKRRSKKHTRQIIIPYFFNARASAFLEKSSLGLYRTIVHQLLSSCFSLRPLFTVKFATKDPGQSGENWTAGELQEFLCDAIEPRENGDSFDLCLFIDALDEAEHEDDVRQMISFLIELSDQVSALGGPCKLQVCFSSRHYPHITVKRGFSLVVEDQPEHGHDIKTYIARELTCLDGPEKDDLRSRIFVKSAHIFLWVVLVVRILNKSDDRGAPLSDMFSLLASLPADLNELFHEILAKSDPGSETSLLLFQWMVFTMQPLEPRELFVAMEYSRSPHDATWALTSEVSVPSDNRLARFILDCSRGLAEVVQIVPSQAAVVQFIHETVREFLLSKDGLKSIITTLVTNLPGISHETFRIACYRRVHSAASPEEHGLLEESHHDGKVLQTQPRLQLRTKTPFLEYAVSYLFDHADRAEKHGIFQRAFLQGCIDAKGFWLDTHRLWWNVLAHRKADKIRPKAPPFRFVIQQQHYNLLPGLLDLLKQLGISDDKLAKLMRSAAAQGDIRTVEALIETGVGVGTRAREIIPALYAASAFGHVHVVQRLIDAGADINAQGGHWGYALQAASQHGSDDIVQILIDAGANVNAWGGYFGYALQAASKSGCIQVVQKLIDAGANVNARGGICDSALHAASQRGWDQTVKLLIEAGADINAHGQFGTALHVASLHGHPNVIQVLITAGANVNAQAGIYGSAIQAAASLCQVNAVRMLIESGADVNAQGGTWDNALGVALMHGYHELVQILVAAGAVKK